MRPILAVIALFLAVNTHASETNATFRTYFNSCGYFFNLTADLQFFFTDSALPDDAKVTLIYGLSNREQNQDWMRRNEVLAQSDRLAKTRSATVSFALVQRGASVSYKNIQFVWEIRMPNGDVHYDKGGKSNLGFYEANLLGSFASPCVSQDGALPEFQKLNFYPVDRF